ncbi:MAG: LLM class flavin-dependent oxidoreductase, partial [Acidobacteria bacterium]|nr:LLM class flavin-dependent oxidoreductase [Acidobacteriota bacterium]
MKIDGGIQDDLVEAAKRSSILEEAGYDGVFTAELKHDPFFPALVAAQNTSRVEIGTGIAVAFARNPMTLANIGYDLHKLSEGRFILGLGSQIKPHITKRFSMPWSSPAARMREMVQAIRAIWASWNDSAPLEFRGEFYTHVLMTPMFDPGPNPYGDPKIFVAGVDPDAAQLVGYWDFEEASGQTIIDRSGAGNDGYFGALLEQDSADPLWQVNSDGECDIGFHNGTILTMDPLGTVVSSLEILDGKISVIDAPLLGDCAQQIDLQGRVLMPGLIDNHVHWFDRAGRPGNNVAQMDNAFSCQDTIDILNREVQVRSIPVVSGDATVDNFVTAIGGITTTQFAAEGDAANLTSAGLPSRQCLDNVDRPVFISAGFGGPSTANSAAANYFESRGITVATDGSISNDSAARSALAAEHSTDDRKRETLALMGWSAGVGLTSIFSFSGDPVNDVAVRPFYDNSVAFLRVRQALGSQDRNSSLNSLNNNVDRLLNDPPGTAMLRNVSLGEFVVNSDLGGSIPLPAYYADAALLMALNGLNHHQHAIPDNQASAFLDEWELVHALAPITDLRWQLAHVFDVSEDTLDRLQALGAGFSSQSQNYAGNFGGGPPYRTAYNHGVQVSAGTDGGNLGPINPWLAIYYMVTG